MRVICFASSKGGVGKSTLAAGIAVAALQDGERPFLIDLDDRQRSLMAWGERREADEPPVDTTPPARLAAAIDAMPGAGYTLAVIDTVGLDTAATAEAMRLADLTLVPCRASALDFQGIRPTLGTLLRLGRPHALVLNSCPPGKSARLEDAGRVLALLGGLAPVITQRVDHVDALGLGLGVTELDPDGKAAADIRALWGWIKERTKHEKATSAA